MLSFLSRLRDYKGIENEPREFQCKLTRLLWFFMKGRRIVAVHGIRNKGQTIALRDLDAARERMRDWQERMKL